MRYNDKLIRKQLVKPIHRKVISHKVRQEHESLIKCSVCIERFIKYRTLLTLLLITDI